MGGLEALRNGSIVTVKRTLRIVAFLVWPLAALAGAPEAFATTYVKGTTGSGGGGGSLPFTGAELTLYVAAGLVLMGSGIGLRLLSRRTQR